MRKSVNSALDKLQQVMDELKVMEDEDQYRSAYRKTTFDNDNVIASFTLRDNDFANTLRMFADILAPEIAERNMEKLDKEKKKEYFTEMWNRSCAVLQMLRSVRGYQVAKWGDDVYEPKGYGNPADTEVYMINGFQCHFDSDAQAVFDEFGPDGNGEFYFIDRNGNTGWA